jgi:hypothetical protein
MLRIEKGGKEWISFRIWTGLDKDLNRESRTRVDNTYTVDPG